MKRVSGKGMWIVFAVVVVLFLTALYLLFLKNDTPGAIGSGTPTGEGVPDFATDLASTGMTEDVTISLDVPKGLGPGQEFSGSGVVDYPTGLADLTYNLGELPNSAGGFGQLFDFDVVYEGATTYIEIFADEPEWVTFEPDEAVGRDIERLREVILSSPLLLPDLLGQLNYRTPVDDASFDGSLDPGVVDTASDSAQRIFDVLSDGLSVTSIDVSIEVADGLPTDIDYTYSFPVVKGAQDEITVTVMVNLEPSEETPVEIPSDDHVREVNG